MYEHLLQLDTLNMTFNRFGAKLIALFLALVMYGVALGMKPHFFKSIFYKPRSLSMAYTAINNIYYSDTC